MCGRTHCVPRLGVQCDDVDAAGERGPPAPSDVVLHASRIDQAQRVRPPQGWRPAWPYQNMVELLLPGNSLSGPYSMFARTTIAKGTASR